MRVSYSRRELKNLGNYENVTFEITAEDDVIHECEGDWHTLQRLKEFVDKNMQELVESVTPKEAMLQANHSDILSSIRNNIKSLMSRDPKNKATITNLLSKFGHNKITQLEHLEAKEFDIKLQRLL